MANIHHAPLTGEPPRQPFNWREMEAEIQGRFPSLTPRVDNICDRIGKSFARLKSAAVLASNILEAHGLKTQAEDVRKEVELAEKELRG